MFFPHYDCICNSPDVCGTQHGTLSALIEHIVGVQVLLCCQCIPLFFSLIPLSSSSLFFIWSWPFCRQLCDEHFSAKKEVTHNETGVVDEQRKRVKVCVCVHVGICVGVWDRERQSWECLFQIKTFKNYAKSSKADDHGWSPPLFSPVTNYYSQTRHTADELLRWRCLLNPRQLF